MTADSSPGPLAGIRVLDLSRVLAGPLCGAVLADLGADVIKIEHPERGDDTRQWGSQIGRTETTYYNAFNRNKRSLTVDLQKPAGQAIVQELAAMSDVLIQNFKLGGAEGLGIGYEKLKASNPGLIYCSITGYDARGAEGDRPGYDLVVQGEAGLMAMNGNAGDSPLKFGVAVVDLFTGMHAAQAVMAAVIERTRTGRGQHVQMALFDCGLTLTCYYGLEALLSGVDPPRYGNAHPSIVPYGVFEAQDGPIVITVGNDGQFVRFCDRVIERPDIATDPRFASNSLRSRNRAELTAVVERELAKRPRKILLSALANSGIPCGEVLGLGEALTSQRAAASGMVTTHSHPHAGFVDVIGPPYRFNGERVPVRRRPPLLGEHSEEILRQVLARSTLEIENLVRKGVVRASADFEGT